MSCRLLLAPSQFLVFLRPEFNLEMLRDDASTGEPAQDKAGVKKMHKAGTNPKPAHFYGVSSTESNLRMLATGRLPHIKWCEGRSCMWPKLFPASLRCPAAG
jgi:hypothetical protein